MPALRTCPKCGAPLDADAPEGNCPYCLTRLVLPLENGTSETDAQRVTGDAPSTLARLRYFGGYEFLEEIARGGMGVVFKARQMSLNRIVAVKLLLTGEFSSPEFIKRFRLEAEAAANLQHPNIVAIHEVGQFDGQHYFSMDYVNGKALSELVRDGPIHAERAAAYLKAIAEAVHYAHQRGVVHRDLKPSNVIIDASDQPRVTDFGLAKRLEADPSTHNLQLTLTGAVMGTPGYMSPEQALGKSREVGPLSDVYSLGAILYCLLTARPPFAAETVHETLMQVVESEPVPPRLLNRSVPRDLEAICLKCLEKSATRRYPTAQKLAEELQRFQNGEPVEASKDSAGSRIMRLLLQETRHPEILRQSCHIWMWHSVQFFLLGLLTNVLIWQRVRETWPYVVLWALGLGGILTVTWWMRFRRGPPLTAVERKMSVIWWMFATAFFLTAAISQLMGLRLPQLLPFIAVEFALGFGCMALLLGGEFYLTAVLCALLALVLVRVPESAALWIGITIGVGLFVPSWRHARRLRPSSVRNVLEKPPERVAHSTMVVSAAEPDARNDR
jgi:eukaryotic-like serine/threonine-protein kinase